MTYFNYSVYGMHIASAIELPLPSHSPGGNTPVDVVIRFGKVPVTLDNPVTSGPVFQALPHAFLFFLPGIGRFLVREGREVCVHPESGVPKDVIRLHLSHVVLVALLYQRGQLPLHASGVLVDGGCVGFIGDSGSGKSTLASALRQRGYATFCDDICAVALTEGIATVRPGARRLQLWADAARALGLSTDSVPRAHPEGERYSFPDDFPLDDQPVPLRRLYILRKARVEPSAGSFGEGISRLRGSEAFMSLIGYTYNEAYVEALGGGSPQDPLERYFEVYGVIARSVPLFVWWRPWGLDRLSDMLDSLENHLRSEPA